MSRCLIGREVVISVRRKKRGPAKVFSVICPVHWKKGQFLRYARGEHAEDSVRILEWKPSGQADDAWEPRFWIANPDGFRDYARAIPEDDRR